MRRLHRDPNRLSSLRMGITQYDEVPAEYVSLLVENYTNAVWISWQQRPPIFEMSACGHLPNCSSLIALILGSSYADFHCRISARRSQRKRALVFVVVTSRTSSFGRFRGLEPLSGFWGCCLSALSPCGRSRTGRGAAAAATWIFCGGTRLDSAAAAARAFRGASRRAAAAGRSRRRRADAESVGLAAAATRIVRADASRRLVAPRLSSRSPSGESRRHVGVLRVG